MAADPWEIVGEEPTSASGSEWDVVGEDPVEQAPQQNTYLRDRPETEEEAAARWRESDAAGAPIPAPHTQQEASQWGETLRDLPTQVRASAAQSVAGMRAREFAELEGSPAMYKGDAGLSDVDLQSKRRERTDGELAVAREAGADLAEIGAKDRTITQRAVGNAASSVYLSGIPMAVGIATRNPALAAGAMFPATSGSSFAENANEYADQRNEGASSPEKRSADFKRAALHGDVQGTIESVTELLPFSKLLKRGAEPTSKLVDFLVHEIPGESVAAIAQSVDNVLAKSPEGATIEEVLQGVQQGFEQLPETWATTLIAGGAQSGAISLVDAAVRPRAARGPAPAADEGDATFESTPEQPRLSARSNVTVDSGGVARTNTAGEQASVAEAQRNRQDLGLSEVDRAVHGRAAGAEQRNDGPVPESRRLPSRSQINVDSLGNARTNSAQEQGAQAQEMRRKRDLGLDEVDGAVQRRVAVEPPKASVRPDPTQNVELYEFQAAPGKKGRQSEVRPLSQAEFDEFIHPVLSEGGPATLEEYQDRYPHASHVRLNRSGRGYALDFVGDVNSARPSGSDVRRVTGDGSVESVRSDGSETPSEQAPKRNQNSIDPTNDSVLTAISKLGGLSREEAVARGLDPKHLPHRGHGINLTFRRSGKKFGEMAGALAELGYPVTDQNSLQVLVDSALQGNIVTGGRSSAATKQTVETNANERELTASEALAGQETPQESQLPSSIRGQEHAADAKAAAAADADVKAAHDGRRAHGNMAPQDGDPTSEADRVDLRQRMIEERKDVPRRAKDLEREVAKLEQAVDAAYEQDDPKAEDLDAELAEKREQLTSLAADIDDLQEDGHDAEIMGDDQDADYVPVADSAQDEVAQLDDDVGTAAAATVAESDAINTQLDEIENDDDGNADVIPVGSSIEEYSRNLEARGWKPVIRGKGSFWLKDGAELFLRSQGNTGGPIVQWSKRDRQKAIDAAAHVAATSPTNDLAQPTNAQKEAENYKVGDPIKLHRRTIRVENPKGSVRFKIDTKRVQQIADQFVQSKSSKGRLLALRVDSALGDISDGDVEQGFDLLKEIADESSHTFPAISEALSDTMDKAWANKMPAHYGRVLGTTAPDGDHIDVFLGPKSADESLPVSVIDTLHYGTEKLDEYKVMIGYASEREAEQSFDAAYPKGFAGKIKMSITTMQPDEFRAWLDSGQHKKPAAEWYAARQKAAKPDKAFIVPTRQGYVAVPQKPALTLSEPADDAARWDALDYGKRQDLAQTAHSHRPIVHRISGSKWAALAPGEQRDMAKAMDEAAAPAKKADSGEIDEAPKHTGRKYSADALMVAGMVDGALRNGTKISWDALFKMANLAFGGTQAAGKYTVKDAYDALELGVNRHLRHLGIKPTGDAATAAQRVDQLQKLLDLLPTQTKRTAEQEEFQQFSTPPTYAFVANWVAAIRAGETMGEPSAGVGGLAVFARNAEARVIVNELSARRAQLLEHLGFDRVLRENAEQLHNVLPDDIKPTVIVMNPPFSSTAGRVSGERKTMNGAQHIEQALKRLEDGGRLVAIVGEGMADDRANFRDWWVKIKQQYNVRANIGVDGSGYVKYGTTFDNQLLVIDKNGPTTGEVVTGKFDSISAAIPPLEGIRNDRSSAPSQVREAVQQQPAERRSEPAVAGVVAGRDDVTSGVADAVGDQGSGDPSASESRPARQRNAGTRRGANERSKSRKGDGNAHAGRRGDGTQPGRAESGEVAGGGSEATAGGAASESGGNGGVSIESTADQRHEGELTKSVFEAYRPQRLSIAGAKPHPGKLVQSAAMASVAPPAPTYTPNLPKEVISKGMLSLAQLEAVVYAGQSHEQVLNTGERRGYFIGDGTGVGKGREISGIILDNERQGRTKSIWFSEKRGLQKDAQRDYSGVGGNKARIFWHGNTKAADKIIAEDGVIFSTYATLRNEERRAPNDLNKAEPKTRLQQIVDWAGPDFSGVLVFDEAHNAGNAIEMKGKRGVKKASEQALAVIAVQKALPQARVVYVSATGATEVSNLSYATRLGVWGPGTPFESVEKFINEVSRGGLAAMELVARDLKQMGVYIARSLSFDDVTYSRLDHKLTDIQTDIYNELATAWQTVLIDVMEALKITGVTSKTGKSLNGLAKGKALSAFWGSHQRFFNQIITSMQMPSVLDQMHKDIDSGHAVVLQLVNTNEATQERKLAGRSEEDDLDDMDLTPRENLIQYLKNSFPVLQYETFKDEGGNIRSRPVEDSNGNLVMSKDAIDKRDKLIANLESIRVPDGPLEIVLNEFGTKMVGEVTGRRRRVVRDEKGKAVIENRGRTAAQADAESFQNDTKRVLIFSDAGGTGFSFQADITRTNQRKRAHYLIQPGWRADKAVQGFGRTHRTNQASAPHYRLVTTDLAAQKRFISSIARKLDQLGALTKGQRDTANQGLFSAKDNLESEYASDAIARLVQDAYAGKLEGMDFQRFTRELGFDSLLDERTGALNVSKIPPVPQFLNRLLSLTTTTQAKVFDEFSTRMEALIDKAIAEGTLDVGMETLPALEVKLKREEVVYSDPKTGAETKYVELELRQKTEKSNFPYRAAVAYLKNKKSGKVWVQMAGGKSTLKSGAIVDRYRLIGTLSDRFVTEPELKLEEDRYERLKQDDAESLWAQENAKLPDTYTEAAHLITGAILPIWDRLPGQIRIVRTQSSDGQRFLGRYVHQSDLKDVLTRLNVGSTASKMTPQQIMVAVMNGGEGLLVNGWKLTRSRVSNENRIELVTTTHLSRALHDELTSYGVFFERIGWAERLFIPVGPTGETALQKLLASKPLADISGMDDDPDGGGDGGISLHLPEGWGSAEPGPEQAAQQEAHERKKIAFRDKHSLESLQAHTDAIAKRWAGVEGLRVKVVDNEYHLPVHIARRIMGENKTGMVGGVMDSNNGVAYLLRDNLDSLEQFEKVLFHEVEGHLSVRQFFGDDIVPFLNRVAMVDPTGVKANGELYGFYDRNGKAVSGNEREARLRAADEYIARLAETVNSGTPNSIQKLWDHFVSHFAEWARKAGWKTLRPTMSEIRGWLMRAQASLRTGKKHVTAARDAVKAMHKNMSDDQPDAALHLSQPRASWDSPEPSRLDNFIYTVQDKHIDLKRVQAAIDSIDETDDAYLKEEMFHGRVATRLQRFLDDELKPFLKRVKLAGLDVDAVEHYLHARHAPERNAQIATINPDMLDGGAGMTNAEAARYMAGLSRSQRQSLEQLAAIVDSMTVGTRATLVGYGLESQATVDTWANAYRHYVPLHREDMDFGPGTGQGFSVRGSSTRRALGSERRVVNIVANIALQRERALVRGEKNRVANALVGLAAANPNANFWTVDKPEMIRYLDPRTNLVTQTIDPQYKNRDNVVTARTLDDEGNVKERVVTFNPHDPRAMRMAQSLKNIDMDDLGRLLSISAKITRYFAAINTQYNPVFGVINLIRDAQAALVNLTSTHLDGTQGQVLHDTISALRGIYIDSRAVHRGQHPTSSWAQLWEEFQAVGGQTGYRDMFRTSNDRAESIRAELAQMSEGRGMQAFHHVRDWLSDFNLAMENAVRLAVYKAGKENHHLSNERAASIAKNVTVNFNRKGQITNQAGALYAFFNASAQGTARLYEVLAGPKGKKIIGGGILLGVIQSLMLVAFGFDDEEPPEFIKERNLIIPIPMTDRKYLTVPYPLGLHVLPNIGRVGTDLVRNGFRGTATKATELLAIMAEAFNPLGNAGWSMQTITPTAIDPLAGLAENKDWTGKPIAREDFSSLNPTPGHARAKASASDFSVVTSRIINGLTGGTDYVPGTLSPTPDQIDYLIGQVTGGVGRESGKVMDTTESLLSGELPPSFKVPLFGRLYGNAAGASSYGNRFYDLVKRANLHRAEVTGRARHGEEYAKYLEENPEAGAAGSIVKAADLISRLRRAKSEAQKAGESPEIVKEIDTGIESIMREVVESSEAAKDAR